MFHFMKTASILNSNKISLLLLLLWEYVAVCVIIDFYHLEMLGQTFVGQLVDSSERSLFPH